jgi:hypothetical protein
MRTNGHGMAPVSLAMVMGASCAGIEQTAIEVFEQAECFD